MIRCPSPTRQSTHRRSVSSGACTTRPTLAATRRSRSAALTVAGAARYARPSSSQERSTSSSIAAAISRLRRACATARSPSPDDHDLVVGRVEADVVAGHIVVDEEVDALARRASRARARARPRPSSAAKPTRTCPFAAALAERARGRRSVGSSSSGHGSLVLRALALERLGRPVVGDGGGHDDDVGVRRGRAPRARRRPRSASRRRSTPAGAGTARLAASSVTSAPRRRASSASATPMRPDERLPMKRTASSGSRVPPAVTSTRLPAQRPAPRRRELARSARRSPRARPSAPRRARPRPARPPPGRRTRRRARAAGSTFACVAGCSHMRGVHRRRDQHRAAVRERGLGEDVVGEPVGELGERVRRQRRDHEQVGALEVRVGVVVGRVGARGGEGLGGDEALGAAA